MSLLYKRKCKKGGGGKAARGSSLVCGAPSLGHAALGDGGSPYRRSHLSFRWLGTASALPASFQAGAACTNCLLCGVRKQGWSQGGHRAVEVAGCVVAITPIGSALEGQEKLIIKVEDL
jgi:hypothetical protein